MLICIHRLGMQKCAKIWKNGVFQVVMVKNFEKKKKKKKKSSTEKACKIWFFFRPAKYPISSLKLYEGPPGV